MPRVVDGEAVIRCARCVIPGTRPDTAFVDGLCAACIAFERRPQIDWDARRKLLVELLDRHHGQCIVPSSGGKDSTYQTMTLKEMGADVTVVTATTCQLTPLGRANIDNLKRHARTIEVSPNATVRAKLNRLGLTIVGDISWPEHVSIFTTPFQAAADLRIPLIFYGENPQNQYGGPMTELQAMEMTRRWVSEFGGFLGLRPDDLVGKDGLTSDDLDDYRLPSREALDESGARAHFLGQYLPWDSHHNAMVALAAGMRQELPTPANLWPHENLDNAQTGLHDHGMYRKYGFGRLAAQASVDVRMGRCTRDQALKLVAERDGRFPFVYAGIHVKEVLARIGMEVPKLMEVLKQHTNWDLFDGERDLRPVLR